MKFLKLLLIKLLCGLIVFSCLFLQNEDFCLVSYILLMRRFLKVCMRRVSERLEMASFSVLISADFRRVPELFRRSDWSKAESCGPMRGRLVFQPGSGAVQAGWKTAESVNPDETNRQEPAGTITSSVVSLLFANSAQAECSIIHRDRSVKEGIGWSVVVH